MSEAFIAWLLSKMGLSWQPQHEWENDDDA